MGTRSKQQARERGAFGMKVLGLYKETHIDADGKRKQVVVSMPGVVRPNRGRVRSIRMMARQKRKPINFGNVSVTTEQVIEFGATTKKPNIFQRMFQRKGA